MTPEYTQVTFLPIMEKEQDAVHVVWTTITIIHGKTMRILAAKRPDGQITFPGGKVEQEEDFEDAAVREIKEETGLEFRPDQLRRVPQLPFKICRGGKTIYAHPFYSFRHPYFEVGIQPRQTEPGKQGPWEWFTPGELSEFSAHGFLPTQVLTQEILFSKEHLKWGIQNWLDLSLWAAYLALSPTDNDEAMTIRNPCWFLDECREIGRRARFQTFRKEVLANS